MMAYLVWLGIYVVACLAFNAYIFLGILRKARMCFRGGGKYAS